MRPNLAAVFYPHIATCVSVSTGPTTFQLRILTSRTLDSPSESES